MEYILQKGVICNYNSPNADPNYITIGEGDLIGKRRSHSITTFRSNITVIPSEFYLPFYFSSRSVMLYRIKSGWEVEQLSQENIVHLVCKLEDISSKDDYLFSDGPGYARFTNWFDSIDFINELDWKTINDKNWSNTEEDSDKQRRKQAEFWTKHEITLDEILGLAVYNEAAKEKLEALCEKYDKKLEIKVKKTYYY